MFRMHGQDVVNQQLNLMRLADIITLIYAMTAVLGRASRAYCTGIAHAEVEVSSQTHLCLLCSNSSILLCMCVCVLHALVRT